jgi:uncharacterized protein (DUF433 family)
MTGRALAGEERYVLLGHSRRERLLAVAGQCSAALSGNRAATRWLRRTASLSAMLRLMNWEERINVDPKILVGKPVVKGTRIPVELVVDLMAQGWTEEQILDSYPNLTAEDIRACLAYAGDLLHSERVYPLTTA